jgi:hypothetical protein
MSGLWPRFLFPCEKLLSIQENRETSLFPELLHPTYKLIPSANARTYEKSSVRKYFSGFACEVKIDTA